MDESEILKALARIEAKLDRLMGLEERCFWPNEDYALHLTHPHLWKPKPVDELPKPKQS